jgi:hypothetical protein
LLSDKQVIAQQREGRTVGVALYQVIVEYRQTSASFLDNTAGNISEGCVITQDESILCCRWTSNTVNLIVIKITNANSIDMHTYRYKISTFNIIIIIIIINNNYKNRGARYVNAQIIF